MPLFRLSKRLDFPPAWLARSDGLLCIGGDLSPKRLILAYKNGIFPWFSENEPILWWSPDPRLVLFPSQVNVSRSLRKKIRKKAYKVTVNQAFEQTIKNCAKPRKNGNEGTWLGEKMIQAYMDLHAIRVAHSVETWYRGNLIGGLYGVSLGKVFFGESMFSFEADSSKIALVALSRYLEHHGFELIDCQVTTQHLLAMGATEISRDTFLDRLDTAVVSGCPKNLWSPGRHLSLDTDNEDTEKHLLPASHP